MGASRSIREETVDAHFAANVVGAVVCLFAVACVVAAFGIAIWACFDGTD